MSVFPEPPRDEFDDEGRHVHPYVRDPHPDASVPGYTVTSGEEVSQEDRSRESRLAFHMIEGFLGHLTPLGLATLAQSIIHRLYSTPFADEIAAQTGRPRDELDPRGELLAFEELHGTRLKAIYEAIEAIVATCPNCGRYHGEDCEEALQPGAYVNAATGDTVSVRRVTDAKVHVVAQVDQGRREIARIYDRDWFEEHFVPAEDVQVLTLADPVAADG
jgi:hypothetical protein